jgi:hypothetical protein
MNVPDLIKKEPKVTKPLYKTHLTSAQNTKLENVAMYKWKTEV